MFLVYNDTNNQAAVGETLEQAYDNYKDYVSDSDNLESLDFYELGPKFECELKLMKKQVIVKVK